MLEKEELHTETALEDGNQHDDIWNHHLCDRETTDNSQKTVHIHNKCQMPELPALLSMNEKV